MSIKVTMNQLTELTGKTYRTIRKAFEADNVEAVEVKATKHFYDSVQALTSLMGSEKKPSEDDNYRELFELEKWREKKRENDLAEEMVAPIDKLQSALENIASQIVPLLEALPLEMKRMNPRLTGHDIQVVKKCIARCRNTMANVNVIDET